MESRKRRVFKLSVSSRTEKKLIIFKNMMSYYLISEMNKDLELASEAAIEAGKVVLEYYKSDGEIKKNRIIIL